MKKSITIILCLIIFGCATTNCFADGTEDCKYTVKEIGALRSICEELYIWGEVRAPDDWSPRTISRSFKESDKNIVVEQMVRTYMAGCIKPKDFYKKTKKKALKRK